MTKSPSVRFDCIAPKTTSSGVDVYTPSAVDLDLADGPDPWLRALSVTVY